MSFSQTNLHQWTPFSQKKNIYDVFDNFSHTHTFSIDVDENFLWKKSQKRYVFVSRALILTNHFCTAYFEQMSRCINCILLVNINFYNFVFHFFTIVLLFTGIFYFMILFTGIQSKCNCRWSLKLVWCMCIASMPFVMSCVILYIYSYIYYIILDCNLILGRFWKVSHCISIRN